MQKIMFNDKYGLTQAVLDGIKTQTRRMVSVPRKFKNIEVCGFRKYTSNRGLWFTRLVDADENVIDGSELTPTFDTGEIVAVAQRYSEIWDLSAEDIDCGKHQLESNGDYLKFSPKGVDNKMFVRPEYMPHQIKITDLSLEHLQTITDVDCMAEGIIGNINEHHRTTLYGYKGCDKWYYSPRGAYAALIDKVNGEGTWDKNPWVWVYKFKLIK